MRSLGLLLAMLLPVIATSAASGQVIQLPQFQYTTVNTTVLVPDQGEVLLGGINQGSDGRSGFGTPLLGNVPMLGRPFKNVGIGQSRSASRLSVKVYIHDFEAMDQALLAEAARRRGQGPTTELVGGQLLDKQTAEAAAAERMADRDREKRDEAQKQQGEIANLIERARAAEADGRPRVAQIYYRIVAHDAQQPELRAMALARLAALSGRSDAKVAAAESPAPAR